MRRIGVLINVVADEQDSLGRLSAFRQALQQLGWSDGGNVRIEARVAKGNLRQRLKVRVCRSRCRTNPRSLCCRFKNMSGGSGQEYFADGIVEDIITR